MNENYTDFYGENFNPDITMFGNTDSSMIGSIGFGNNLLNENFSKTTSITQVIHGIYMKMYYKDLVNEILELKKYNLISKKNQANNSLKSNMNIKKSKTLKRRDFNT